MGKIKASTLSKPSEWVEYDKETGRNSSYITQHHVTAPWEFRWHYHSEHYEVFFHTQTAGKYLVGDSAGELLEGDVYLLAPELPHSFYHIEPSNQTVSCFTVRFTVQLIEQLGAMIPEFHSLDKLFEDAKSGVLYRGEQYSVLRDSITRVCENAHNPRLENVIDLFDILLDMGKHPGKLLSRQLLSSRGRRQSDQRLDRIFEYLIANYREALSLEEIARAAHTSVSNLCAYFRKRTGLTITQYINQLKISRACELLREEKYSILDISQECGYANLSYFNRQFRKTKGMAPSAYRKAIQGYDVQ